MRALEYFEVECPEEAGAKAYKEIASDILLDLNLVRTIGRLHIYIDPEFPFFLAVGRLRSLPGLVRVRDFANVLGEKGKITLDISTETYLAQLLSILWDSFGRDRVEQPDRFTIEIREDVDTKEIEDLVVYDPSEGIHKDLIYALQWIAPEGFKVRRQSMKDGHFYYVASENTLPEDVISDLVDSRMRLVEAEA